jgi:hypothetical protein
MGFIVTDYWRHDSLHQSGTVRASVLPKGGYHVKGGRMKYGDNPNFCPYCGAPEIQASKFDVEGRVAYQWVRCDTCKTEWHDVFELVAIEKVEIP